MSRLEKMSIQGIRSFSPDSSEKIEFFLPVTLILGPNGTGKTTIIECLKYATTGELPPGSKVGGSFVHDPKLAQEVEVKAKVGLALKDITGNNMIVTRSMMAVQKAKTIQTRTLDGVIKRQSGDGAVKSISSKCADLDRDVVASLGVSKPVLESVIFCHQEESNWPLSEGKAVKQRFDDIFASTRYVKALEVIRKTKQEQDGSVKVFKNNVAHVKEQNAKAQQLREDLEEKEMALAAEEDSLTKLSSQLTPLKEELSRFRQQYQQLCIVQAEMDALSRERRSVESTITRLRDNVGTEFAGSDAELRAAIAGADEEAGAAEGRTRELDRRLGAAKREAASAVGESRRQGTEKGRQEQEAADVVEWGRQWAAAMEAAAAAEGIAGAAREAGCEERETFHRKLEERLRESDEGLKESRKGFEAREADVQKDLDRQRAGISRLEQSKAMKRQMVGKQEAEARRLRGKLSEAEASVGKLQVVRGRLEESEKEVERLEAADESKTLRLEIEAEKEEMAEGEKEIAGLETKIAAQLQLSQQLAEKAMLEKERKEKENLILKTRSKLADALEQIFTGAVPSERLRSALEAKLRSLEESRAAGGETVAQLRSQLSSLRTEAAMMGKQLGRKRTSLSGAEERLRQGCGGQTLAEAIAGVTEKKKKAEEERAFIQGSVHTFGKFKERLGREKACPLCHRGFEATAEVEELIEELERKLSLAPRDLRTKEREVEVVGKKFEALVQLRAVEEEVTALNAEVEETEKSLNSKTQRLGVLEEEAETAATLLEVTAGDETAAKAIHGDVVVLERFENELAAVKAKLERLERQCGAEAGGSLEELQAEKRRKQEAVRAMGQEVERKRERAEKGKEAAVRAREKASRLRQEVMGLEQLNKDKLHFAEELDKANAEVKKLQEEMKEEEKRFAPIREAILELEREQGKLKKEKESDADTRRQRSTELRDSLSRLQSSHKAVKRYHDLGKDTKLQQLRRQIEETERSIAEKEAAAAELAEQLETLKSDVANHKMRQRELADSLEIREKTGELGQIAAKLKKLGEEVGGMKVTELSRNLKDLEKKEDDLTRRKQMIVEKKTSIVGQMKVLEKELKTPLYKEAEKRFQAAMHELKTSEVAASDLEKYYRALDRAIMSYHAFKMEEINKIVKELWRNTYKGNDIDYVEIRSDEDEAGVTKSRRTYNYRVVMVKSDTALDMRGRCSAGQKVLASLIIRLALSEAFCLNCGVLALDEPTTNLDRENIESLAFALVEIIRTRSRQKNFQLIVITHDEDFVELLGRSEYVENFFRISRNSDGLSEIRRLKIEEEFH